MDRKRHAVMRAALSLGGPGASPETYEEHRLKVLELAFTPEETLAEAERQAESGTPATRKSWRKWMRVQAQAEQGQRFEPPPGEKMVTHQPAPKKGS